MDPRNQSKPITKPNSQRALLWVLFLIGTSLLIHILCMSLTNLMVEEAYYWNYAQHLDFSYLDHPPLVALLIKSSTLILGTNEFGVRISGLLCWALTAFYSYQLTELIQNKAGFYAVMLLAVLPFFFFQTLIITPDVPLIACWSGAIYYLYRALVLRQSKCWYVAGIWLGVGMLSKYTMVLLGLSTFIYLIITPTARFWLKRKEPYIAGLITALIFTPVIYWNAKHHWISFLFQSKRRFSATTFPDLHYLLALILLFITPIGVWGLWELLKKNRPEKLLINSYSKRFLRVFTLVPLGFFFLFSINHEINLNWAGPLFLALIPWLAILMTTIKKRLLWLITGTSLLTIYLSIFLIIGLNTSEFIQQKLFIKVIAWESLVKQFHQMAQGIETKTKKTPVFVPLDNFPIASELSFYQAKLLAQGAIFKAYPVIGSHILGGESLMYHYWSKNEDLAGAPLLLISKELWRFNIPELKNQIAKESPLRKIWSSGQNEKTKNIPFYYQIVYLKVPNFPKESTSSRTQ